MSTTLYGHDDDVKALACLGNASVISGSRDTTVRVWNRTGGAESNKFDSSIINYKSTKFINCLAVMDNGLIVSGGNDNLINITASDSDFTKDSDPLYCLVGHEANVCSLDTLDDMIISGSWDGTAKVWSLHGDVLFDLKGHQFSVWGVKFISHDEFLTCGADGTLRLWKGNKIIQQVKAHEDVVRDVLRLSNGDIATCSNDTTIKIWDFETFELKSTLIGHQNFIYSLALAPNGDLISCSEDRSIRIWRDSTCIQVITLPCISVWKVIVLPNGDIVSGSSDSLVRIFSKERITSTNELEAFQKELESSSISSEALNGSVNKSTASDIDSLKTSGQVEGEVKYVQNNGKLEAYQWTNKSWLKIGEIVEGNSSNQKKFYNGSYYDFVFDVDIQDGVPPLKLPFNSNDNPYNVAEKFLADNDLPYSYLQEIVNFILQNAGDCVQLDSKPNILPIKAYVGFEGFNESQLINGFKKLNSKQREDLQQDVSKFETMINCQDYLGLSKVSSEIIEDWEEDSKLIAFDILRGVIFKLNQPYENLFPIIKSGLESKNSKIQMMTIRVLVNTFLAKKWGEQIFLDDEVLDVIFTREVMNNKNEKLMFISLSTLILNFATLSNKFQLATMKDKLISIINELCQHMKAGEEEGAYRLLCAYGTLDTMIQGSKVDKDLIRSTFENYNSGRFKDIKMEISI